MIGLNIIYPIASKVATENGIVGYPIHYCPICGEKLK